MTLLGLSSTLRSHYRLVWLNNRDIDLPPSATRHTRLSGHLLISGNTASITTWPEYQDLFQILYACCYQELFTAENTLSIPTWTVFGSMNFRHYIPKIWTFDTAGIPHTQIRHFKPNQFMFCHFAKSGSHTFFLLKMFAWSTLFFTATIQFCSSQN